MFSSSDLNLVIYSWNWGVLVLVMVIGSPKKVFASSAWVPPEGIIAGLVSWEL